MWYWRSVENTIRPIRRPAGMTASLACMSNVRLRNSPGTVGTVTESDTGFSGSIQPRVMTVPVPVAGRLTSAALKFARLENAALSVTFGEPERRTSCVSGVGDVEQAVRAAGRVHHRRVGDGGVVGQRLRGGGGRAQGERAAGGAAGAEADA